jgi:RimJ/RimL family protein N-acetyltransferase
MNSKTKFQFNYILTSVLTFVTVYHSSVFSQAIKPHNLSEILVFSNEETEIVLNAIVTKEQAEKVMASLSIAKNLPGGLKEYFKYIWSPTIDMNSDIYDEAKISEMLEEKIKKAQENTQKNVEQFEDKKTLDWISFEAVNKTTETPVGMTTLHVNDEDTYPSVGIYVYPKLGGTEKGVGTKIIKTLMNYHATFFEDPTLGWDCYESNTGSVALAKKFNFTPIKEAVEAMGVAIYYTKNNESTQSKPTASSGENGLDNSF